MQTRKVPPYEKAGTPDRAGIKKLTLHRFALDGLCLLVLLLPVLFSRETVDPVFSIRYLFLSSFVTLFLLLYFLPGSELHGLPRNRLIKVLVVFATAYAVWCVVSAFFSINGAVAAAEISRYLLNLLVAYLFLSVAHQSGEAGPSNLFKGLVIVSLVQTFIVLMQYYELGFMGIPGTERPFGMMVHRNLFSSAQVCLFPFASFVLYKGTRRWKWMSAAALGGIFVSVVISLTRASWLSLAACCFTILVLSWFFLPQQRKLWSRGFLFAFLGCSALLIGLWATDQRGTIARSFAERAGHLARATTDSSEGTQSARLRLQLWSSSLGLLNDQPVVGVGPGNWKLAVGVYGQRVMTWKEGLNIPGRAHNVYLQMASETGIPGWLLYMGMWLTVLVAGVKVIVRTTSRDLKVLNILILGGLIAFSVDNLFSFAPERIEHSLYAAIMGAAVVGSYATVYPLPASSRKPVFPYRGLLAVAIAGWNVYLAFAQYQVERHERKAVACLEAGRFADVLEEVRRGENRFVPLGAASESLYMLSAAAYRELNDTKAALQAITAARSCHPNNPRMWTTMGVIYADLQRYDSSIACYQRALGLATEFRTAWINLAYTYFETGQYAECLRCIRQVNPEGGDSELLSLRRDALRKLNIRVPQ